MALQITEQMINMVTTGQVFEPSVRITYADQTSNLFLIHQPLPMPFTYIFGIVLIKALSVSSTYNGPTFSFYDDAHNICGSTAFGFIESLTPPNMNLMTFGGYTPLIKSPTWGGEFTTRSSSTMTFDMVVLIR